jgi:hypothetical protein
MDLDRIASAQHGLVTLAQLRRLGVSDRTLLTWRHTGRLHPVQPRVDRVAGAPMTWEQRVLSAVLSAGRGAAASHASAGRLWGIHEPADPDLVEIVVPTGRSARLWSGTVHHTRDDIPAVRRHGVPTTNPLRTIVDLGATCTARQVEDALDRALVDRLCTVAAVEWELARVARPGRRRAAPRPRRPGLGRRPP